MDQLKSLMEIFELQKPLVKSYQRLYGLPEFPLDVDDRDDQETLRHLFSSTIEELVEMFEAYDELLQMSTANEPEGDKLDKLRDLNLEAADVLHFFMEIFLYVGIEPLDIDQYAKELAEHTWLNSGLEEDKYELFSLYEKLSSLHLQQEGLMIKPVTIYRLPITNGYTIGTKVAPDGLRVLPILLWDITVAINLAQNTLKNKPWKLSTSPTDVLKLKKNLLQAFYVYLAACYTMGGTSEGILHNYKIKNNINLERIKSKY